MKLPFKTQPPEDLSTQIKLLSAALDEADCIIAGAGAGLSTSAGFLYSGERFRKYFSDFEEKYNFHDMYSSGFYPYDTLEEYWAFWNMTDRWPDARYACINLNEALAPEEIAKKSICIEGDIGEVLAQL